MPNPLFSMLGGMPSSSGSPNILSLIAALKGGNPQQALQSLAASNPKVAEAMHLLQDKSPEQLERICRALCAQKGMDYNAVVSQIQNMLRG